MLADETLRQLTRLESIIDTKAMDVRVGGDALDLGDILDLSDARSSLRETQPSDTSKRNDESQLATNAGARVEM